MDANQSIKLMNLPRDFRGPRRIMQIWVTRSCDKACFNCTQGSNLVGKPYRISPEQFETACKSLKGYPGVIAMFGGNPCIHPNFEALCEIARKEIPYRQRGIWTNNLLGKGGVCRSTFYPGSCNFNVHMDSKAAKEFEKTWPETRGKIKGLNNDCGHSPVFVSMKDLEDLSESSMWEAISRCDINKKWSPMIGVFRNKLRGWFCEVAGSQSIQCQEIQNYPDTGVAIKPNWWKLGLESYGDQILQHCPNCAVPLRGRGQLAVGGTYQQSSKAYEHCRPRKGKVEVIENLVQLKCDTVKSFTAYSSNWKHQVNEG